MKFSQKKQFKTILLLSFISFMLLTSLNTTTNSVIFNSDEGIIDYKHSEHNFSFNVNGKQYLAEYITREKVEELKTNFEDRKTDDNVIIDGHGTGYSMPSEEDLESLIGQISLVELVSDDQGRWGASKDISTEIYFPAVGDQGTQGSCSAWANAYYAYGYLEAKDYGWDASSGNPDYLLSPAWAYNIVSAYDYGSIPYEVAQVLLDWGVPTLGAMPYDDSDVDSWGDETAWRQAPYHRPLSYTLITYSGPSTITLIKNLLDGGTPVTIGIDASQFSNGLNATDYILSSDEYASASLNHAQCFVGYDDAITEGSDVGAFRVVNSWGADWVDGGYYWLTYDAFAEFAGLGGQVLMFITDRIDYNPKIIATWEFSSAPTRMDDIITLGVGPHDSPLNTTIPLYDGDTNNLFPEFMAFDLTSFYSDYTANNDVFFYLDIGPSDTTGTISSFRLERYLGGVLQEISLDSPNVPEDTPGYANATFMIFDHELKTYLTSVPINPLIYNSYQIDVIIINNGANDETSVNFDLFLNNVPVHSMNIPNFPSRTNITVNYPWTPTEYEIYNFTAYVTPVPGEKYISNNHYTKLLYILGTIFYDDFENGLSKWVSATGLWHLTDASSIWPDPYHSPTHSMWFGNESTGDYETGFREFGNLTSIPIDLTGIDTAFLEFYHWRNGEGGGYDISFVVISTDGIHWDIIYGTDAYYIAPWEKIVVDISAYTGNSSVQICFYFDTFDSMFNYYRGWLIDDVGIMGTGVVIPHDLRVSLEVPESPQLSNTYAINATVTNIGSNSETNVDFYLYLNGIVLDSISIPNLLVGATQTINYDWTPTKYGVYNFTAYAPPVPGEEFTYNNYITEIIPLHKIILFDGLYLNHTFSIFGIGGTSIVRYTQISEFNFYVEWDIFAGMPGYGRWEVDAQTRIMSSSMGGMSLGNGFHTPFWVFTDIEIGNIVPIAVGNEGDHTFIVSDELDYVLAGGGTVKVWQLEDLTIPGGIALYEKNTGLLLEATFLYNMGLYNYTFNYVDTNASFQYVSSPDNLLIIIVVTGAIVAGVVAVVIIIVRRKRK